MTVRVVRLIEYVYPDHETAEKDMGHWGLAANGRKTCGPNHVITSAIMLPRTLQADEAVVQQPTYGPVELVHQQGVGTNETVDMIFDVRSSERLFTRELVARYNELVARST
jgi:hypothetical protein